MTELQSAELNRPRAGLSPRVAPQRRVESCAPLGMKCACPEIWSCTGPGSALVLVLRLHLTPSHTHLIHLWVERCTTAPPSDKDILGKRGDVLSVPTI